MCDYIVTFYSEHRQVLTTVIVREEHGLIDDVVCEMALKQLPSKLQKKFCRQASQRFSVGRIRISGVAKMKSNTYDNGVVFDYDAPLPEYYEYRGYYEREPSDEWDAHLDDYDDLGEC